MEKDKANESKEKKIQNTRKLPIAAELRGIKPTQE